MRLAKRILKRAPGVTDMHALVAAEAWRRGERVDAEREWDFACNAIDTGCRKYRDASWLKEIRRWPDALIDAQLRFLDERLAPQPRAVV